MINKLLYEIVIQFHCNEISLPINIIIHVMEVIKMMILLLYYKMIIKTSL